MILIGSFLAYPLGWKGKLLPLFKLPAKAIQPLFDLIKRSSHSPIYYPDFSMDYAENAKWRRFFVNIYNYLRSFGSSPLIQGSTMLEWNTEQIAKQIEVPTLLIHGADDGIIPVRIAYKDLIPGSKLVVLDGGHMIQASNPEKVNRAIEEFL